MEQAEAEVAAAEAWEKRSRTVVAEREARANATLAAAEEGGGGGGGRGGGDEGGGRDGGGGGPRRRLPSSWLRSKRRRQRRRRQGGRPQRDGMTRQVKVARKVATPAAQRSSWPWVSCRLRQVVLRATARPRPQRVLVRSRDEAVAGERWVCADARAPSLPSRPSVPSPSVPTAAAAEVAATAADVSGMRRAQELSDNEIARRGAVTSEQAAQYKEVIAAAREMKKCTRTGSRRCTASTWWAMRLPGRRAARASTSTRTTTRSSLVHLKGKYNIEEDDAAVAAAPPAHQGQRLRGGSGGRFRSPAVPGAPLMNRRGARGGARARRCGGGRRAREAAASARRAASAAARRAAAAEAWAAGGRRTATAVPSRRGEGGGEGGGRRRGDARACAASRAAASGCRARRRCATTRRRT